MKKFKLLLAALAAMVGLSASAWDGSAGKVYLQNVGSGLWWGAGNDWGTRASLVLHPEYVTLIADGTNFKMESQVRNGGTNYYFNGDYMDNGSPVSLTITASGDYYTIANGTTYYGYDGSSTVLGKGVSTANKNGLWRVYSESDMSAMLTAATSDMPIDATYLIADPNFGRNNRLQGTWTMTASNQNLSGGNNSNNCAESYHSTFTLSQTLSSVPNGWYSLTAQGFYRQDGSDNDNLPEFYANDKSVTFPLMGTLPDHDGGKSESMGDASVEFTNGNYTVSPIYFQVTDGQITLGARNTSNTNLWCIFDNFVLTYYGTSWANTTLTNPTAVPSTLNANTNTINGWIVSGNAKSEAGAVTEFWNQSTASISQTLANMPAGYYTLTAVALTREGMTATLAASSASMSIATVAKATVNNQGQAVTWFNAGNGVNTLIFNHATAGDLTISLTADNTTGDHWMVWKSFNLIYHGDDASPYYKALRDAALDTANDFKAANSSALPTAALSTLTSVLSANSSNGLTAQQYFDEIPVINAAVETARTFIDPYARFLSVKANVVALKNQTTKYTDPGTAVSTFDTAVAAQQTAVDEATTVAAIETAIVNLRKAASAFAGNVDIVAGQYLDMTDAMLYNASMRNSGDLSLWTIVSNTNTDYPKYANNCSEFWKANFDFYQTAYELPAGNYNIEVSAFHRAAQEGSTYHTFLYANSDQVLVLPLANGEDNTAAAEASFNNGLYTNSIKITLDDATDVNIGFKNEDTAEDLRESGAATDKWTIFRDFKIKYFGDDALALYRDEYEEALAAATEALSADTYTNVAGTDRSNLNTTVNTTYPKSVVEVDETQEKFETATAQLTALTTTFKNGVASWNNYANTRAGVATAKAEADLFDEGIYTGLGLTEPTTAAEAAAKATGDEPAIRVATAQHVATNYTYSLTSKIGDFSTWTGTALDAEHGDTPVDPQTLNSEHWSNTTRTYYEQSARGWYSSSWSVTYTKVANNLPAGNYVLKLAARGSVDSNGTIASSATTSTVTLPTAGNNTRGITTAGVASWSDSDTFRKSAGAKTEDNKGAGWQWRFLPFTVSEAGDVTLTINVSSDLKWNWVSLADAELLSDEDKTTKITLSDASDMTSTIESYDGELATVTLQRGIKVGYNTVVLPFDLTAVQVQAVFGSGAVVYSYSENSENANSAELTFTTLGSGAITANVPVLVKATAAATEKVIEGVTIEAPESDVKAEGTNFDYVGVYDNTTFATGDYFMATKNDVQQIFQSDGTDYAKPFRAYFKKKTTGNVKATLFIEGIATAIEGISADNHDAVVFNLAGQRVQKAQRGLYIQNGKKVLVK